MLRLAAVGLFSLLLVGCAHTQHGGSAHSAHSHTDHGFCHDLHAVCKAAHKAKHVIHGHSHK